MPGNLTVTCGPMFAGKSTTLYFDLVKASEEGRNPVVFKPETDTREVGRIVLHGGGYVSAVEVDPSGSHALSSFLQEDTTDIFIDEVQFFNPWVIRESLQLMVDRNIDVHVYGLDLDYRGQPWPMMEKLLPLADEVRKLKAKCQMCGKEASKTTRLTAEEHPNQVLIGASDHYEPRCNEHFFHENTTD